VGVWIDYGRWGDEFEERHYRQRVLVKRARPRTLNTYVEEYDSRGELTAKSVWNLKQTVELKRTHYKKGQRHGPAWSLHPETLNKQCEALWMDDRAEGEWTFWDADGAQLLDEADGSVLDDIIIWWRAPEVFDVMPNASNTDRVVAAVGGRDVTPERAVLAVQGPTAHEKLARVSAEAAAVKRFRVAEVEVAGAPCVVAGTGYTGEPGVEIAVPAEAAHGLWDALLDAEVHPAGLGARDTLRLEAALPLHGQELGPGITPLQAGLNWVVAWDKPAFRGKAALEAERDRGVARSLRGLEVEGRRPPRTGQTVLKDGTVIGEVTSGNFSPSIEQGIALAFLAPGVEEGADVVVDIRGTEVPARVVALPFRRS
jgi:aminomethyltransferase